MKTVQRIFIKAGITVLVSICVPLRFASGADLMWSNAVPFTYVEGQTAPRPEVRDPCIVRAGNIYYLAFTMWLFRNREEKFITEPNQGGSPGIALYASRDLKATIKCATQQYWRHRISQSQTDVTPSE